MNFNKALQFITDNNIQPEAVFELVEKVKNMDCLVQVDIDSFKNPIIKGKIKKYIECGYIQFAGSDCHDTKNRKPNFDVLKRSLPELMCYFVFDNCDITF